MISLFNDIVGQIPTGMEPLVYALCCVILIVFIDSLVRIFLGLIRWRKL